MTAALALTSDDRSFMYAVVRRIVACDDLAADATQDALLRAHRYRDQFRGDSAHRTWLYRIATTTALGHLRRRGRTREQLAVEVPPEVPDPAPDPEHTAATRELVGRACDAIAALGPDQRAAFLLRVEEHTEPEIAAALGITIANVKIRTYRARQRLRQQLVDDAA